MKSARSIRNALEWKKRKLIVWTKGKGRCWYCGRKLELQGEWHAEHLVPRARQGEESLDNLVPACVACNWGKGDKSVQEYRISLMKKKASPPPDRWIECFDADSHGGYCCKIVVFVPHIEFFFETQEFHNMPTPGVTEA